jgi:predicted RNA-binding protein with PIN domain
MPFPPAAQPALLRAMGSYLRAAPKGDLPAALLPLAGRHQKMLARHKTEILAALESNDALRALVAEWLDDKPRIAVADAHTLRLAATRPDGWEEALTGRATPAPSRPSRATKRAPDEGALARANERAKKAKEEARKIRTEAERAVKAAERRAEQLAAQVAELTGRVKALEKETAASQKETAAARADAQREIRKARRRADQAERTAKDGRKELNAANAEIKKLANAPAAPKRPPKKRSTSRAPAPPAKRSPLPAPKGRLAEAPETLQEWLRADRVHLLIDGYNVSKARGGFGDLSLESQRRRLIQEVGKLVRGSGAKATIVFDGSEIAPWTSRRARTPVAVEYSRPHEIADDHLIAKLQELPNFPVIVVTSDRELQDRAGALGATIARSDQLLAVIR